MNTPDEKKQFDDLLDKAIHPPLIRFCEKCEKDVKVEPCMDPRHALGRLHSHDGRGHTIIEQGKAVS